MNKIRDVPRVGHPFYLERRALMKAVINAHTGRTAQSILLSRLILYGKIRRSTDSSAGGAILFEPCAS
ncbi:hypothetical protein P9D34_04790 [Bacillus swezeyi]|uniref:Uncharacterized protein n=1 Tax=Bacillus swezeyi TaxID=1925020 RepID=A0A1R1QZI0_9BACI|nr:hypothetical protein [Bacillus swezeyi]MEC1259776.1 hypothetical protein [Bacillus swezeyi]MED2930112.1 hypothetical protein [Bacillus swezeyi]MED2944825.1 hypothetical protein [Bacillus swezeyi]MED2962999.1 hypothetical protein [Bacillus swezeyi]MED2976296.1 hypothetical protein [Bacillus swezeyi]